jgi:hypothetical protein
MHYLAKRNTALKQYPALALALVIAFTSGGGQLAFAQSTGSPVNSKGQASISGQPYVKTHKRHNKNFYGKHYNVEKHSKQ